MKKRIVFYTDERGDSPVRNFILNLPENERSKCFEYIWHLEELGESVRRPIGDYLGNKIYELRPKQTRIIYFFMLKSNAVLIHAFRKRTSAIPISDLSIAMKRMNDYTVRFEQGKIKLEDNLL